MKHIVVTLYCYDFETYDALKIMFTYNAIHVPTGRVCIGVGANPQNKSNDALLINCR